MLQLLCDSIKIYFSDPFLVPLLGIKLRQQVVASQEGAEVVWASASWVLPGALTSAQTAASAAQTRISSSKTMLIADSRFSLKSLKFNDFTDVLIELQLCFVFLVSALL